MVVKAQGEARSAELVGEAIKKNKAYLELKKIENARLIAQQMQEAGAKNRLLLDAEGLGLNVFETTSEMKKATRRETRKTRMTGKLSTACHGTGRCTI